MCSYALSSKKVSCFKDKVVRNAGSSIAIELRLSYNENAEFL